MMARSVKTQHNCASLNLQYKALNTISEILAYYFEHFVLSEERA